MSDDADEDADFRETVAHWDRRLAEAGEALEASAPSANVWDRISARLDQLDAARDTLTVSADQGVWEITSPGVWRKRLHVDSTGGWQALLLKVDPGASVPAHSHPVLEECLVLEGEFEVDGETVRKGDLHLGFAGHDHGAIFSRGGAMLYLRAALDG